ncbi:hypothetical protein [Microbacterium sp. NPDC079995]|uniref:PilN domain-containing protein n=1 Tax=unclassified Microbacterium TaxID=2609290 RepID=UPI00344CE8D4
MTLFASRTPSLRVGSLPRVDLLPPSEIRRRDTLARARLWLLVGLACTGVAVLAIAGAFAYKMTADLRLATEQSRTAALLSGIAELSDVSEALADRTALQGMRRDAMAGDLEWRRVVELVADRLPPGVSITGYSLDAGPAPVPDGDPATATGVSGTITFTSPAPIDFVQVTRDVRSSTGMRAADVEALTSAEDLFTYSIRVDLDQTVYSGDYDEEAAR